MQGGMSREMGRIEESKGGSNEGEFEYAKKGNKKF